MSQPLPEREDEVEAWRDLQVMLEERDREWWADDRDGDQCAAQVPHPAPP